MGGVDHDLLSGAVGGIEAQLFDDTLKNRMQPPSADILSRPIHLIGDFRHRFNRILGEFDGNTLRAKKGLVLADQRRARLAQDAGEIGRA